MTDDRSGDPAAGRTGAEPVRAGEQPGRTDAITVLLVDDDELWARTQGRLLERHHDGIAVTTVNSYARAVELVADRPPDCVVCDYRLGDGTGLELLETVRDRDGELPFVLVTGKGSESLASDAIGRGVTDYVRKDAVRDQPGLLTRRVSTLVRSSRAKRALARERRIKETMLDIVTETTSRESLCRTYCRHLVSDRGYECAWIGTTDAAGGVVPAESAGADGYVEAALEPGVDPATGSEPALVALDRGEAQFVDPLPAGRPAGDGEEWRRIAADHGFESAAAVPLTQDGVRFGVLAVYATDRGPFDDRAQALLAADGSTVGHALRTTEWKRSLFSDERVAVDFVVTDDAVPLVGLCDRLSGSVAMDVPFALVRNDEEMLYVADVAGASRSALADAATRTDAILSVGDVDVEAGSVDVAADGHGDGDTPTDGDVHRCEIVASTPTPESIVVGAGGRFASGSVEYGQATVSATLPEDRNVRSIVDALEREYGAASLATTWTGRTNDESSGGVDDPVESLTDRQREAFELALTAGYFERPRGSNTGEVAEMLDVSPSTFTQHLRAAQRKLASYHLDPGR